MEGKKSPYPLPKDYLDVAEIIRDFGNMYRLQEKDWWETIGKKLYGISAPLPMVSIHGQLNKDNKESDLQWNGIDSIVAELPLTLTVSEALKQLRRLLTDHPFASAIPKEVGPKYQLTKSKLRIETLQNGLDALRMYKKGYPLWRIGNQLRLIPAQSFLESEIKDLNIDDFADRKEILSIAARRHIKCAALITENAVRGHFPSNQNFSEAIVSPYQRKAGRPEGTKRPKRH